MDIAKLLEWGRRIISPFLPGRQKEEEEPPREYLNQEGAEDVAQSKLMQHWAVLKKAQGRMMGRKARLGKRLSKRQRDRYAELDKEHRDQLRKLAESKPADTPSSEEPPEEAKPPAVDPLADTQEMPVVSQPEQAPQAEPLASPGLDQEPSKPAETGTEPELPASAPVEDSAPAAIPKPEPPAEEEVAAPQVPESQVSAEPDAAPPEMPQPAAESPAVTQLPEYHQRQERFLDRPSFRGFDEAGRPVEAPESTPTPEIPSAQAEEVQGAVDVSKYQAAQEKFLEERGDMLGEPEAPAPEPPVEGAIAPQEPSPASQPQVGVGGQPEAFGGGLGGDRGIEEVVECLERIEELLETIAQNIGSARFT